MRDEAVNNFLTALKLIPDWLVTSKIIKNLFTALYADENILYFNEGSSYAVFNCNDMGIVNVDLNNYNLDDNFDKEDLNTIIFIKPLAWHTKLEKRKEFKKELNEKLMPVAS